MMIGLREIHPPDEERRQVGLQLFFLRPYLLDVVIITVWETLKIITEITTDRGVTFHQ
jgi:hypothetical protein